MNFDIQIEGLDEVRDMLRYTAPREARRLISGTMRDMAQTMVDIAKADMPVNSGRMQRSTRARSDRMRGNLASSTVLCTAFYWIFVEHGDGPDGVEHAMFMKAQEKVMANADRAFYAAFNRALDRVLTA